MLYAAGTLCLERTMWWTMQEAEEPQRLLQNHLDVPQHCTTQAGLWMPQYTHLYSTAQCTLCLQYRYVCSMSTV